MPARKPTRLKKLAGTLRPGRVNLNEPEPPVGAPPPRRGMPPATRAWYVRLAALVDVERVATKVDGPALELLADALAERDEARAIVRRAGPTYTTTTPAGSLMSRPHPAVAIAADAWRRASVMLREYGLTSASRPRVSAAPEPGAENEFGALNKYFDAPAKPPTRRGRATAIPVTFDA